MFKKFDNLVLSVVASTEAYEKEVELIVHKGGLHSVSSHRNNTAVQSCSNRGMIQIIHKLCTNAANYFFNVRF